VMEIFGRKIVVRPFVVLAFRRMSLDSHLAPVSRWWSGLASSVGALTQPVHISAYREAA
jgi:hypothetical protein